MARTPDPIDRFARFLAQSEHGPLTIKNFRLDLHAFADWLRRDNGEPKAATAARFAAGAILETDEPYLLDRFTLLRNVIEAMAEAAIRKASIS